MIERPRLKSFLTVFMVEEGVWGIRGGGDELWRIKLKSPVAVQALGALLPFLDGRRRRDEILDELERQGIAREASGQILAHLESNSLVEEADGAGLSTAELERYRDQITFFSRFTGEGGGRFQAALGRARAGVAGGGRLAAGVRRQLSEAGVGEVIELADGQDEMHGENPGANPAAPRLDPEAVWPRDGGRLPDLLVVAQERHDPVLLEAVDGWSKRERRPWLLLRALDVQEGWVGPLFVPGETASYLSLDARLKGNLPFYGEHQAFDGSVRRSGRPAARLGGLHAFFDLLAAIAAVEAVKHFTGVQESFLAGRFLTVNPWTWEIEAHEVLRVPGLDRPSTPLPPTFPWKMTGDDDDLGALR